MILVLTWIESAGKRALKTACDVVIGYMTSGGAMAIVVLDWREVISATAIAVVLSFCMSLVDLPELGRGKWKKPAAILTRVIRTAGQVAAGCIGAAAIWSEVNWAAVGVQVATACAIVVLTSIDGLPEVRQETNT